MGVQQLTLGQKGSGHYSITLRVTYTPAKNGFYVTKYEGYRTGARSWSDYDASLNLILNGTYYPVTCRPDAQNGWWANFWNGSLWVNQSGGYLEFTVSGGDSGQWKSSWFQYDLPSYHFVLRISNMDCYGNYGSSWVWQEWWSPPGYSGSETAYSGNSIYNAVTWSTGDVWGNVDYTLKASRKKTNFSLSCVDENGTSIPFNAEFSDNNGSSYTTISANPYTTQYVERPYKIKNVTSSGYAIDRIIVNNTTITPTDGVYSFTQATSATTVKIYMVKSGVNIRVKKDNSWVLGKPYVKKNGNWIEAKDVYIKQDGVWKKCKGD